MTSRDLVNIVQGQLKGRRCKVGHCGTLDPLAEGVLVVGVGPAVRLVPMVQDQPKHYWGSFRLGASSPTGDLEVVPTEHPELPVPSREQLATAAEDLLGEITQIPPAYSAVKVDGRRAYDRVRAGQTVEMPSRTVRVDRLLVTEFEFPKLMLDIVCGSGTYIRSLGLDLAKAVGTTAVMTSLKRLGIGPFQWNQAVSVDQIRSEPLESLLLPPSLAVSHLPMLTVDDVDAARLANGLCVDGQPMLHSVAATEPDVVAAMTQAGRLRALLKRKRDRWCPFRVFPVD